MNDLQASLNSVFYAENGYYKLNDFLKKYDPSRVFILVDNNTHEHCLSKFLQKIKNEIQTEVIEIEAGEEFKHLQTCEGVWNALSELEADRKSLVINLGGGVVTDLGGFVASTFKRGIKFINIPTTLLSMVDASVGGKTGVDLGNLKNQIGVINQPEMVLIDATYLTTLSSQEMRSGLAEILKHGLIADESYWKKVSNLKELDYSDLDKIIEESVSIKGAIVDKDPFEQNLRKTLNYGHTLGHAIESYCLTHPEKKKLLHGEAIAAGMILETYLSVQLKDFPNEKLQQITEVIKSMYGIEEFSNDDIKQIKELMKFDKKNERGNINFVLLEDIGKPVYDVLVPDELIQKAFDFYLNY
ncbi:3-dehydroquinate synthase [Christiangramia forsetii]|uniref:3-dehydroquinate synthase n=2 Tax=Christiangramia forsetii TaxID=411153 RepID=A0M1H0_CHRFK|nr:3-dehydroquinate synthase [Christiangramia forsetii]GGG42530.1 3-dehydroquinate synthase [Christiangramia forsetii]CAL66465.1 3-dehydroquinate synthase [Christiangramia forsetii KT0803]